MTVLGSIQGSRDGPTESFELKSKELMLSGTKPFDKVSGMLKLRKEQTIVFEWNEELSVGARRN